MAQEIRDPRTLEIADDLNSDQPITEFSTADPSLTRSVSFSRLNARAPEFVPRAPPPPLQATHQSKIYHRPRHHHQPLMHVVYHHPQPPPPPPPMSPQFVVQAAASHGVYDHHDFYGGGFGEHEEELDQDPALSRQVKDGLSEEVVQKITKQVYFLEHQ